MDKHEADGTSSSDRKKKQKQLRKGLLSFLKRLRSDCKEFDSLGDWEKFVEPLQNLLEKYAEALSPAALQTLKEAIKVKDATKEGIESACKLLDNQIERTIIALPVSASFGTVLIGALIAVAVAIPIAYAAVAATARELTITNTNCGDFQLYPGGINLAGLRLPERIDNNAQVTARVPGFLGLDVDIENNGMTIWVVAAHHFSFSRQVQSATFNGTEIVGNRILLKFGSQVQNELTITCQ